MSNIYTDFKKHYLKEIQQYSRVLVYDGAEPVDTEVVIEDIEYTELDNIELYDDQQRGTVHTLIYTYLNISYFKPESVFWARLA